MVYAEPGYLGDIILQEADKNASRDEVTVLSGQNLAIGTVLGKATIGNVVSEAHIGNTGNGNLILDGTTPAIANCQVGTYSVICIVIASTGGIFEVFDSKGYSLGLAWVGIVFASHLQFTISAGSIDFVLGDTFFVTVAAGSGKVQILTPTGFDGTQKAYGILTSTGDASAADAKGVAIVRDAIVKDTALVWPDGILADEKAAALAVFEAQHIIIRQGV